MKQSMNQYLPSKKLVISVAIIIGAVLIFFGIKWLAQKSKTRINPSDVVIKNLVNPAEVDTDGDGVPDWEEALWGTDPRNQDSDADGISDGAYIARKKQELGIDTTTAGDAEPLDPTNADQIARDIYSYIAIAQQSGTSEEEIQANVMTFLLDRGEIPDAFTTLATVTATPQTIQSYAQKIQQYTDSHTNIVPAIEKASGQISTQTIDPQFFTNTGALLIQNAKDIAGIGGVPSGIRNDVLDLVNRLNRLGVIMTGLGKEDADPLMSGMYGLQFHNTLVELNSSLENIGTYFNAATNRI